MKRLVVILAFCSALGGCIGDYVSHWGIPKPIRDIPGVQPVVGNLF